MSKIINEAKIKNPLVVKIRELLEHRAFWLYLLNDEAEKRGLGSIQLISPRPRSQDAAFLRVRIL